LKKSVLACLSIIIINAWQSLYGCDICGCYTPDFDNSSGPEADLPIYDADGAIAASGRFWATGLYGAIAEQFTYFGTVQVDGHEASNPTDQHLNSSITQLVAGYAFKDRFALQLNLPLIYRSFRRPEGFEIDNGTESGLGDISLLGQLVLYQTALAKQPKPTSDSKSASLGTKNDDFACSVVLVAGVKFPTGDTSRIKEEFHEEEVPGAPESGIHGHDLTLGTGSFDGIFGLQTSCRYRDWFLQSDLRFTLRGEGVHQYDFANDFAWGAGPGYYIIHRHGTIVGLQLVVSGEHKNTDRFRGQPAEDTGITSVFIGPRIVAAFGKVNAEIALDLPVSIDNTAFQVVPDYRIRGAIAIRF
jgi:hypothetical protein